MVRSSIRAAEAGRLEEEAAGRSATMPNRCQPQGARQQKDRPRRRVGSLMEEAMDRQVQQWPWWRRVQPSRTQQ